MTGETNMPRSLLPLLVIASLILPATCALAADPAGGSAQLGEQRIEIETVDLVIILAYLVGIVALGCWAGMRRKEAKGSDYFLASKSLTWPVIGLALFATNISTIHLVSFAQNGVTSGLVYGNFEWMAAFTLVILSLFFAPFYLRSNVATLPDFMEKRYSRGSRDFLAILSIFSAVMVHIGFSLLTGAIVLEGTVLPTFVENPDDYRFWSVIGMCGATAIYTIIGGLLAVVLTESIQTIVLLVGAICITFIGYNMVGGWGELKAAIHPANFSMLRPSTDPTGITWYAVFLGYPVLGVWYWCTDQTIVQRVLGARDENHARIGPLFAGFIKILPVFLFVLPGMMCLALLNEGKIAPLPTHADGTPNTETAYTHMIKTMLSPGLRGVVIAAMLAALMSTVSGALNSIATLFSYDIYKRWKPDADDRHLVWVGRIATAVAMCVAIAWTMGLGSGDSTIFQRMVDVFPVVAPPTAVVFLWGVFWRKTSARAALLTLLVGSLVGLAVFVMTTLKMIPINSLFMAFLLFVAESVFIFLASLVFPHTHTVESEALVWKSPLEALRAKGAWRGLLDFRVLAALLVIAMVGLYFGFSSSTTYYPIEGEVTLDGSPVVGAAVFFETDADRRLNAELPTGVEGKYAFGTTQRAGGAPAGTEYRVRIVPQRDFIVLMKSDTSGEVDTVLEALPLGTPVQQRVVGKRRLFVFKLPVVGGEEGKKEEMEERTVAVDKDAVARVLRATDVPEKYREFVTSGLTFTVPDSKPTENFELKSIKTDVAAR